MGQTCRADSLAAPAPAVKGLEGLEELLYGTEDPSPAKPPRAESRLWVERGYPANSKGSPAAPVEVRWTTHI